MDGGNENDDTASPGQLGGKARILCPHTAHYGADRPAKFYGCGGQLGRRNHAVLCQPGGAGGLVPGRAGGLCAADAALWRIQRRIGAGGAVLGQGRSPRGGAGDGAVAAHYGGHRAAVYPGCAGRAGPADAHFYNGYCADIRGRKVPAGSSCFLFVRRLLHGVPERDAQRGARWCIAAPWA